MYAFVACPLVLVEYAQDADSCPLVQELGCYFSKAIEAYDFYPACLFFDDWNAKLNDVTGLHSEL